MSVNPTPDRAHRLAILAAELGMAVPELTDPAIRADLCRRSGIMRSHLTGRDWKRAGQALADITRSQAGLPVGSVCKRCRAPVRFVDMSTGSRMPLDPLPHPLGNIVLERRNAAGAVVGRVLPRREVPTLEGPAYRSHFVTCPYAEQLRRRPRLTVVPPGPTCTECSFPLHQLLVDAGETRHPLCVPDEEWPV